MSSASGPFEHSSPEAADPLGPVPVQDVRRALAYCSANDRNVPVLIRVPPRHQRRRKRPSYRDAETLQCLDYGVRCTGFLCPLFDIPTLDETDLTEEPHRRPSQ